ncbi:MAG: hypothetical protein GY868_02315, partial [Deltaproteobacteria bacterium]|nr:hypothetical protein [Deltaproteobacteria bacterium]
LERSAAFLPQPFGGFLQVSGLRLTIDPNGTPQTLRRNAHNNPAGILQAGSRIKRIEIIKPDGSAAQLQPETTCSVAINSFLADGGDGYPTLQQAAKRTDTHIPLSKLVADRLAELPSISPTVEGRITIK